MVESFIGSCGGPVPRGYPEQIDPKSWMQARTSGGTKALGENGASGRYSFGEPTDQVHIENCLIS